MKLSSLFLLAFAAFAAAAEPRKPNIIFILSDDLAQGDIGCYGQKLIQTPHLDRMAKEGTRFTQGYCGTTVCAPSRTSLMVGQHSGHSPVRANREIKPEGQLPLPTGTITVAKILQDNGYATACMGKWGMGMFDTTGSPLKNGFDHFFGYNCQRHAHSYFPTYLYRDDQRFELPGNTGKGVGKTYAQELIQQDVERWVRAQKDKPFFLFYAITLPHGTHEIDDLGAYKDKPWTPTQKAYAAQVTRLTRMSAVSSRSSRNWASMRTRWSWPPETTVPRSRPAPRWASSSIRPRTACVASSAGSTKARSVRRPSPAGRAKSPPDA